jgi:chemotaxis family two-component system response regulator Rcp1
VSDVVRPLEILLVDDDSGDVLLMHEALRESSFRNTLRVVKDGVEAMAYLRREASYEDALRPDVVLLDLNLPRKDGREVLADIKQDPALRAIPVVILTTSTSRADILCAYDLHANLYVNKPVDLDEFLNVVKEIDQFFSRVVRLPPR